MHAPIANMFGFLALASPALAQTVAPIQPAPAPSAVGDIANWWWIVLVVVLAAAAFWYFARGRRKM